tara:strand:- start:40 stop:471 length:432 start_codon:yes stop_codon:yes gene_type:complete
MNPEIKWVRNARVEKNSRIPPQDIISKEYRRKGGEIIVTLKDSSKKLPIINVEFPSETQASERREKNSAGKWITKSWSFQNKVIASINTQENYIHFNRTRFTPLELNQTVEVVNHITKIILKEFETTSPTDSFSSKEKVKKVS